jgi:excisionase family DNA binding protein
MKLKAVSGQTPDLLFTRQEAASKLRISTRSLDRLVLEQKIGHVRIGWRVLFRPVDLEAFVARRAVRSQF